MHPKKYIKMMENGWKKSLSGMKSVYKSFSLSFSAWSSVSLEKNFHFEFIPSLISQKTHSFFSWVGYSSSES
jgi:hypothetical protein